MSVGAVNVNFEGEEGLKYSLEDDLKDLQKLQELLVKLSDISNQVKDIRAKREGSKIGRRETSITASLGTLLALGTVVAMLATPVFIMVKLVNGSLSCSK